MLLNSEHLGDVNRYFAIVQSALSDAFFTLDEKREAQDKIASLLTQIVVFVYNVYPAFASVQYFHFLKIYIFINGIR